MIASRLDQGAASVTFLSPHLSSSKRSKAANKIMDASFSQGSERPLPPGEAKIVQGEPRGGKTARCREVTWYKLLMTVNGSTTHAKPCGPLHAAPTTKRASTSCTSTKHSINAV